ncbi:unnamed protein product, partial [Adineta steineri]
MNGINTGIKQAKKYTNISNSPVAPY